MSRRTVVTSLLLLACLAWAAPASALAGDPPEHTPGSAEVAAQAAPTAPAAGDGSETQAVAGKDADLAQFPGQRDEQERPRWKSALMGFGFLLFFVCLLWIPSALRLAWDRLKTLPRPALYALGGTVGVGLFVRLFIVPHQVVTMYMGYLLTGRASEMADIPRYGVGSQAMWRSMFQILPADHAWVIALNCVLGALSLVWLAAILKRWGTRPLSLVCATLLMAFLPQFLWSDASDSLSVAVFFWTLGAAMFAQEYLRSGRWTHFVGAVAWLALAAHTRPEHVVFGPLLVLVLLLGSEVQSSSLVKKRVPRYGWPAAIVGYCLLALPQVLYAMHMRAAMIERGGWPHRLMETLPRMPEMFFTTNALFDPNMVPIVLGPLAILGLFIAPSRRARLTRGLLLLLGALWLSFYQIDISVASLPRLHVVLAIPAAIVAGLVMGDLAAWRWSKAVWLGPLLAVLTLGGVAYGIPQAAGWLWHPTNERTEEEFFRAAADALPEQPFVLVRPGRGDGDGPNDQTHRHHPDYLVRRPAKDGFTMSLSEFMAKGPMHGRVTYAYLGMRCHSQFRREGVPRPESYVLPACQRLRDTFVLEPILEKDVPNYGDRMLPYYSNAETLRLGLYRINARRSPSPHARLANATEAMGLPATRAEIPFTGDTPGQIPAGDAVRRTPPDERPKDDPGIEVSNAGGTHVVPPGQEALIEKMVGGGEPMAAGCSYESATIEISLIQVRFACAGGAQAELTLGPPTEGAAGPNAIKTAQFTVTSVGDVPAGLPEAVAARVREHESSWRWGRAHQPERLQAGLPQSYQETAPAESPVDPELEQKYWRAVEFLNRSEHQKAYDLALEIAREEPRFGGVLGIVVGNLAPLNPDHAQVAQFAADADADPDDPLKQFLTGVGAHYCAHYKARSREDKKELYRTAIRYLERSRPAYDFEPRVFIYLAVSHFRLGHQDRAEAFIDHALKVNRKDPDAFYCRAEIMQFKEPARSLEDLRTYTRMTAGHKQFGEKPAVVRGLIKKLEARLRGEEVNEELFDPLVGERPEE